MAYSKQFKDEDFLNSTDTEPMTTKIIARRVGCSRNTAITFLQKLEGEGKVKKIVIEGGTTTWVKVDTDVNVEPTYEPTLEDFVLSYQQKHPDDELAQKLYEFIIQQMNSWRVGQYIVWESDSVRESIREHFSSAEGKPKPKYKGEPVFLITKCKTNRIYVKAVGVVAVHSKLELRIYLNDKIRIATPEEVKIAEETPIPKLRELKDES